MKSIIFLLAVLLLLTACSVPDNQVCGSDNDCVPDTCCHAKSVVNIAHAPDCSKVLCTMNCEPDTLDCGQGTARCSNGQCQVVWN